MVPLEPSDNLTVDTHALITQLRRKEGSWVQWGHACQTLQKAGLKPQEIFEGTGFEPSQQNQIIVAVQVYDSVVTAGAPDPVLTHFQQRGSDILYELRVLSQSDRARAAEFILQHGLEADAVKDIVKALKEYSYFKAPPSGFTDATGDAAAYHYWNLARQKSDLQARSRLIAQGLRFASSDSARQQIEKLLTDFAVVKTRPTPILPIFRLEDDSELPRIIPVVGAFPLKVEDFQAVPVIDPEEPFGIVKFSGTGAWVAVPGWQVIFQAEDPVSFLMPMNQLPNVPNPDSTEIVLVVIDRARREWDDQSYLVADQKGEILIQWFAENPEVKLLGKLIVVIRPKHILDENYTREFWQYEE